MINVLAQVGGFAPLLWRPSMPALYAGCIVVGLGVGNTVSLPGLLVGREFSLAQFASVVSLITATNQETPRAATAPRWRSVSGSTRWRPAWS